MQFRSIVPLFIVVCLIIVAFFGNLVESENVLGKANLKSNYQNRNNLFGQRLRRRVRNVQQRYRRQYDGTNTQDSVDSNSNGFGNGGGSDPNSNAYQGQVDQTNNGANQGFNAQGDGSMPDNSGSGSVGGYQR